MRFVHTADLHLGRKLQQMSLEEDFEHVLVQLYDLVARARADALVVAGDVFDSANPTEGAVRLWDRFITGMAEGGVAVLAIGGGVDAGAHLSAGSDLLARSGIHDAGSLTGKVQVVEVDGVNVWLLPFVKPADVAAWAHDLDIVCPEEMTYDEALGVVCDHIRSRKAFRKRPNVLVAHQLVCAGDKAPIRCDSEQSYFGADGGVENVDVSRFDGFDYVALGHCHVPQSVGRDTCRYAGSPLKLSASEATDEKSFNVVGIKATPDGVRIKNKLVEVEPLHDFRCVRGTVSELVEAAEQEGKKRRGDYVSATVTDAEATDAVARLRQVWPNLVQATFEAQATKGAPKEAPSGEIDLDKGVDDLFREFYRRETGRALSSEQETMVADAFARAARKGDE